MRQRGSSFLSRYDNEASTFVNEILWYTCCSFAASGTIAHPQSLCFASLEHVHFVFEFAAPFLRLIVGLLWELNPGRLAPKE